MIDSGLETNIFFNLHKNHLTWWSKVALSHSNGSKNSLGLETPTLVGVWPLKKSKKKLSTRKMINSALDVGAVACALFMALGPWCGSCCLCPFQSLGFSMVKELLPLPLSGLMHQHGVGADACALSRIEGPAWCETAPVHPCREGPKWCGSCCLWP